MKPTCADRQRASAPSDIRSMRSPATWISPESGRSSPPSRFRRVVFPEPDGPITATKSPRGIARFRRSKITILSLPLTKLLLRSRRSTTSSGFCCIVRAFCRSVSTGCFASRRPVVVEERHLDRHVRKDARVLLIQFDPDFHRRLLAIGGRYH